MNRRTLLIGGAVASLPGCTATSPRAHAGQSSAPTASIATGVIGGNAGTGPLTAIIEYGSDTHRYEEAAGTDLGDYVDPLGRFTQSCVRVTHELFLLTVMFRRDRGSNRAEAVFELGQLWSKAQPANLGAYRVTILRGDTTVFSTNVPNHFWFSRWRWQSAARPVTVKLSSLMASGLLPKYDPDLAVRARRGRPQGYEIMGLAGLARVMPMTGERDDIGPVTEAQGEYLCTERQTALSTLLAQAEAGGTYPWCMRDENTGAPLDVVHYDGATVYEPRVGNPFIARTKTGIQLDAAHEPALAYVPFLLTGDPYYLEILQFQNVYNFVERPPQYRYAMPQARANAWSMRTLGQLAKVTPDKTPRWLLPRANFQTLLDGQRDWMLKDFVHNLDIPKAVFRTTGGVVGIEPEFKGMTIISPWQDDFQAFSYGWLVRMGHSDWDPIFRWKLGATIARTDGTSGWARAFPTTYRQILRESVDAPWAKSWAEDWAINARHQNLSSADPNVISITKGGQMTYLSYARGVLAIANELGVTEAMPCYDWMDRQLRAATVGQIEYKWSIAG